MMIMRKSLERVTPRVSSGIQYNVISAEFYCIFYSAGVMEFRNYCFFAGIVFRRENLHSSDPFRI